MFKFDANPNVIAWASEEVVVPYYSPVDKKNHKYYVDFYIKTKRKDGTIREVLIEVKPKKQTVPPKEPKRRTRRFYIDSMNYVVNEAKWKAANSFCKDRKWEFMILTEEDIFA